MNLQSTDFEIFGLPPTFSLDEKSLVERWKTLQGQVHPDKFVANSSAEKRVAMQWSVRINEAYRRLKDPLKRAQYLCELNGIALGEEDNTAMPAEFLMQQMQWREAMDDASTMAELEALRAEVQRYQQSLFQQLERLLDVEHAWQEAAAKVRALMFVARFMDALANRLTTASQD